MTDERKLDEAIARCVAIMVYYQNARGGPNSAVRRDAGIRAVVEQVAGIGLAADQGDLPITRPVEDELIARYGPQEGPGVVAKFMRAFRAAVVAAV